MDSPPTNHDTGTYTSLHYYTTVKLGKHSRAGDHPEPYYVLVRTHAPGTRALPTHNNLATHHHPLQHTHRCAIGNSVALTSVSNSLAITDLDALDVLRQAAVVQAQAGATSGTPCVRSPWASFRLNLTEATVMKYAKGGIP